MEQIEIYGLSIGSEIGDLEWPQTANGRYFAEVRSFGAITSNWLRLDPDGLQQKCSPMIALFDNIWFVVLFSEIVQKECSKRGTLHSTPKNSICQHCAAISTIAEHFISLQEHVAIFDWLAFGDFLNTTAMTVTVN